MAMVIDRHEDLQEILSRYEKGILLSVLDETGWRVRDAAKRLGIRRATLYVKLKKYGLLRSPGGGAGCSRERCQRNVVVGR